MTVAVVGTGGVGGYFGARLFRGGLDVRFIARGRHLAAMREAGLRVECPDETLTVPPAQIAGSGSEVGTVDVVLFCVKSYDTESAAPQLGPLLHRQTVVISLQNGVDNEATLQRLVPEALVFGGVAYIYATIAAPGLIREHGGPRKIVFGPLKPPPPPVSQRAREIAAAAVRAGVQAELTEDMTSALWKKFVFITAVGGMTALSRLTLGELLAAPESRALLADAMRETIAVARARGATIEDGYLEETFTRLAQFDNATRSSLYHDLVHGRPLELEALSGAVVRYGRELGIATPVHRVFYALLLPAQQGLSRSTSHDRISP